MMVVHSLPRRPGRERGLRRVVILTVICGVAALIPLGTAGCAIPPPHKRLPPGVTDISALPALTTVPAPLEPARKTASALPSAAEDRAAYEATLKATEGTPAARVAGGRREQIVFQPPSSDGELEPLPPSSRVEPPEKPSLVLESLRGSTPLR
jgi:hypothetical protein